MTALVTMTINCSRGKLRVRTGNRGRGEIEVRYRSGLQSFSIFPRSTNVITNRVDINTEDTRFDSEFRTTIGNETEAAQFLSYLTPQRREVIYALDHALHINKVKHDEFDVHMANNAPVEEIREAVDLCIRAAKALEAESTPQDAIADAA